MKAMFVGKKVSIFVNQRFGLFSIGKHTHTCLTEGSNTGFMQYWKNDLKNVRPPFCGV